GIEHVVDRVNPGAALPPDTEVAELITMLVRFRTQAVAAVSATLAFSIESTIESAVGQILGDFIEKAADADTPET
ncbi:MAG TPA: MerR family transcriptional regulator, partial [Mycobacterium sp.]|nr:MerR family transcriptional regulator [Mycobacterium sp.]